MRIAALAGAGTAAILTGAGALAGGCTKGFAGVAALADAGAAAVLTGAGVLAGDCTRGFAGVAALAGCGAAFTTGGGTRVLTGAGAFEGDLAGAGFLAGGTGACSRCHNWMEVVIDVKGGC